jgi:pyrimidine operon attenuation protein / uracil phosphoribosyltransferase
MRPIMNEADMDQALDRIASEIIETLTATDPFALIGIRRRGVHLARRIAGKMEEILQRPIPSGILDINLYRDDLSTVGDRPLLRGTAIEFAMDNRNLVLVDDVLYTGRTIHTALRTLLDMGRPKRVQLAVMIDRGHRELPIQAEYVGKYVQTADDEIVEVRLMEEDQAEQVVVVKR